MADSGYTVGNRREILQAGITRYYCIRLQETAGIRRLYHSAEDMSQARNLKPLKLKAWYKTKRGGTRVSAKRDFPMRKGPPGREELSQGRQGLEEKRM